ncbi:glutamate receptor ionotropic, kainate 2-like isoform X6 [Daphnia pulex]|uniref:glutamate receptor ionotropic, kainate 2-like isoform X6 n=1 Tax=Daphnia pulex TaxID=6669 RepID=UPI001EDE7268|nr:glutamate receptor ionotropic, kainate 2-like isoform X6 [Daphnia pulex]
MGAAAVRKREKWKWLLPSWAPATTLSGTHEETFRADDIRLSAGYWSSSSSSWNSRSFTCLLALAFIFQSVSALPPVIRIGGIFREDQKDGSAELAFKYAVYRLNRERTILPNTTLVYDIQYVPRDDSFRTSKKACKQIDFGVQAIFGPSDPVLGPHVQSICDALDIPHLETRLDLESRTSARNELSINLHPSQEVLNAAYKDLMRFLNWTKVAIIYEDEGGLLRLQDLVRSPPTSKMEVHIRQGTVNTYRQVLREIKQRDINNIIVDTRTEHVHIFFRAVLQLQMNDYQYHYLFASPDLETFDLEDFKYNFVNISAFRIVDAESNFTRQLLRDMEKFQPIGQSILNKSNIIQAEPALVYDSVMALAHGLAALDRGTALRLANLSCDIEQPWNDGSSLFNYINTVEFVGLTGPIRFKEGRRSNITLDLLKLKRENLTKVGEWNGQSGLNITDPVAFYEGSTPNITLIVMTNEEMPYVMLRSERNLTGNDRYEGFCIDLLKAIAGMVGFNYVIEMVPDKKYGALDPETGEWNGVVRQILEKKADLAVGSMTINYAREMVIDFTKPFMNLGISILFKIPTSQPTRLFSFMNPLAVEIWLYVMAAYILVSFTLFVMARFSPYEWNNPHPCNGDSDVVENQFSISNSFWFITGTFLRQGSGLNPKVPTPTPTRLFSFMNPLAVEIWLFLLLAYVLVSLSMWVVARFTPYEWHDNVNGSGLGSRCHHCHHYLSGSISGGINQIMQQQQQQNHHHQHQLNHDALFSSDQPVLASSNDFSLANSFWFTIGTLMQQGSDLNPKAASTRIVGGIWWFFTLIIISSYTANLAAFLTVERMIAPIDSVEDLADQSDISYGTLEAGSTMTFFRDSRIETYQKMWRYMESKKPSVFVSTYEEGTKRVMEGNFAFLMESTTLDYVVQRNCNLTQIGGLLDSKGYGIGTPKGSPWRDRISLAILELQEKGSIHLLYNKWWKDTGDVCNRDDKNKESKASALGVENIGGVFVVLLCGLAMAIVVAILEFCWNSKRNAQQEKQSLCSEMGEELRFALRCQGSRQRPTLRRSCLRCTPPSHTYVPTNHDVPPLHGVRENGVMPMIELRKASIVQSYDLDN